MRWVFYIPGLETAFSLIARENGEEGEQSRGGEKGEVGGVIRGRECMFVPNKNHNFESIIRT